MKQIKSIITLLAFALLNSFGTNANATKLVSDTTTFDGTLVKIGQIRIVGKYDAEFIPGENFSYKVLCDADYADYLNICVDGDKFEASIKPMKSSGPMRPKLTITYPANYYFNDLDIHVSVGATMKTDELIVGDLDIDVIAGAEFSVTRIKADKADFDVKAGSTLNISSVESKELEIDNNSGSTIDIKGINTASLEVDGSSGASGKISGHAKKADIDLSSAALIICNDFSAETAILEATTGASLSMGTIEKWIEAKATTGGTITYYGKPTLKSIKNNTGGVIKGK